MSEIDVSVKHWKATLQNGEKLQLAQIGDFWCDAEGNIQFQQDRNVNLLLSAYGLESLHFVATVPEIVTPAKVKNKQHFWRYAAAATLLLPLAFYSFWIPTKTDVFEAGMISYKDFNPFYYMISRSQNRVCHGKGYTIDYTKFSTAESFIIKNDLENIKDSKYYNEYYDEHSDNDLQIEKIEYLSNYEIQSEFTEKQILIDNIFNVKISKKNRNNLRNGFILNNDCFELNKYYYSNNSRLLFYSNNHLYFEKKDSTKKEVS
jgi:hypothetical protein